MRIGRREQRGERGINVDLVEDLVTMQTYVDDQLVKVAGSLEKKIEWKRIWRASKDGRVRVALDITSIRPKHYF